MQTLSRDPLLCYQERHFAITANSSLILLGSFAVVTIIIPTDHLYSVEQVFIASILLQRKQVEFLLYEKCTVGNRIMYVIPLDMGFVDLILSFFFKLDVFFSFSKTS